MSARPASYTADRADRVVVGQYVHEQAPLLSVAAPAQGWVQVSEVDQDANGVLLSLSTGATLFFPRDRLVYAGS